ncbi:MAG: Ubiquinone/menaquinone biosynthesis C-methyltransferase UbiE [Alphaproteobacteria bacterium MarineAlpha9_Bin4]|nr:MAG: Ubiquinone/menaquinone biosynthesis C-methyltransferase UbiE [Alphaproteobacteria bacterium MarineAlpha9_Bin4]
MRYNNKLISDRNKKKIIKNLFNDVSHKYDLMNDLMSLRLHRLWKKDLIKKVKKEKAKVILDLAGGTGDISSSLAKHFKSGSVYLYDLSFEMISFAKNNKNISYKNLFYINASADQLAFKDSTVDIITLAFGLRNFSNLEKCIRECRRVLKYGKKIYVLEFSPSVNEMISPLYEYYSSKIIPVIGKKVANNKSAYEYLIDSIKNFPQNKELENIFTKNGFFCYNRKKYLGGVAYLNIFTKI